ncbi:hypothetical protein KC878_02380 [Candidatus Saccharibacteria bacterium]|nr:hypothetical protein [Candidatus Saccharibacteria bacterium]MCB9821346.1 hypothetical protein [Candidatus Nomurabacteria bacterium]
MKSTEQNPQPQTAPQPAPENPTAPQPVQYVVTQESLDGIGGWLLFFMVVFALTGLGYITTFFAVLEEGVDNTNNLLAMVFSPIIAIPAIAAVVLMALRKKIGVYASFLTLAASAIYAVLNVIVASNDADNPSLAVTVSSVITILVVFGLLGLYFFASKRVKQTLTK